MDHAGREQDREDLEWYRKNSKKHPPKRKEIVLSSDSVLTADQVAKSMLERWTKVIKNV